MKDGQICEDGTYDELRNQQGGLLSDLVRRHLREHQHRSGAQSAQQQQGLTVASEGENIEDEELLATADASGETQPAKPEGQVRNPVVSSDLLLLAR